MIKLSNLSNILLPAIAHNNTIKTLNLNGLLDSAAPLIAKIIKKNKTLEYVTLSATGFDNKGSIAIDKALKKIVIFKNTIMIMINNYSIISAKRIVGCSGLK